MWKIIFFLTSYEMHDAKKFNSLFDPKLERNLISDMCVPTYVMVMTMHIN